MGIDKHYQIASWVYQQGDFVSINEIAKQFGLSRGTLYRHLKKITNCKGKIVTEERFYKASNQWQRQLRVCLLTPSGGQHSVQVQLSLSCIWRQLISRNWGDIDLVIESHT